METWAGKCLCAYKATAFTISSAGRERQYKHTQCTKSITKTECHQTTTNCTRSVFTCSETSS